MKSKHKKDILLDDHELLQLAEKVVSHYAYTIPSCEREDVKMTLVENFLTQKEKITAQFQGKSKTSTYCIAVLNRMCCTIIRKELRHWQSMNATEVQDDSLSTTHDTTATALLIEDEIRYLTTILTLLNDKFKMTIFLALYYLLKAKESFISTYDSHYQKHQLMVLLDSEQVKTKREIFEKLAIVHNRVEQKNVKPDAIRMWLNKEMKQLMTRMNGPFDRASYDKDSFQVLFEYYYEKE